MGPGGISEDLVLCRVNIREWKRAGHQTGGHQTGELSSAWWWAWESQEALFRHKDQPERGLEHWELELLPNIGVEWVVANAGG